MKTQDLQNGFYRLTPLAGFMIASKFPRQLYSEVITKTPSKYEPVWMGEEE